MADEQDLVATGGFASGEDGITHTSSDLLVRLTPRRLERVVKVLPCLRLLENAVADRYPLTFKDVVGFDDPVVSDDVEALGERQGGSGLLRALERRGPDFDDVAILECLADALRQSTKPGKRP